MSTCGAWLAPAVLVEEAQLVTTAQTVRSHVKSIMRKLEVSSRGDACAAAERLRLAAI